MAITYKWDIPQMNAHIQAEGEQNVIYTNKKLMKTGTITTVIVQFATVLDLKKQLPFELAGLIVIVFLL